LFSEEEVACVTGSSMGIGRATSLKLAEEGCNVIVHYGSSEAEAREVANRIEALGRDALLVQGDVANASDVRRMAREIEEHYGRLDVLVNNAGSMIDRATLEEMTEEMWDRILDVNLKSVYLCSQALLPLMKWQGQGWGCGALRRGSVGNLGLGRHPAPALLAADHPRHLPPHALHGAAGLRAPERHKVRRGALHLGGGAAG
jgi:NAD(P)-dependent dehydrogenase (short-subunit alcohol dehydrogenase family)